MIAFTTINTEVRWWKQKKKERERKRWRRESETREPVEQKRA